MSFRKMLVAGFLCGAGFVTLMGQDDLPSLLKAGADLEQRGEWIKAEDVYAKAAAAYPSQSIGFERLGDVFAKNGAYARAAENYRKALQVNPDNEQLRVLLQSTDLAAKEQQGGVVHFRTVRPETVPVAKGEPARIPVHIGFPRSKFSIGDLDETARRQLNEVAALLVSPEWRDRRPVVVEGHTCSCGSDAANLVLGRKRGEAVLEYLIAKNALRPGEGSVMSMGKSSPVIASDKENLSADACARDEAHNLNRRVIIREARGSSAPLVTFWYKPLGAEALRPLTDGSVLYRKDELRVKVEAPNPMFAYVVHHGPDNAWEVLYPRQGAKHAALLPADADSDAYWIPGKDSGFTVTGKSGDEEALVYLSPAPIPEFEAQPKPPKVPPVVDGGEVVVRPPLPPTPPTPPHGVKPSSVVGATGTFRSLRDDEVFNGLSASASSGLPRIHGLPRGVQPVASVKFKSHD